jgi:hypothetical protein
LAPKAPDKNSAPKALDKLSDKNSALKAPDKCLDEGIFSSTDGLDKINHNFPWLYH